MERVQALCGDRTRPLTVHTEEFTVARVPGMGLARPRRRRFTVLRTLGAAVGALLVILFLVIVASKLSTPPERQEAVTQDASLRH